MMSKKMSVFVAWLIAACFVCVGLFGGVASAQKAPGMGGGRPAATSSAPAAATGSAPVAGLPRTIDQFNAAVCNVLTSGKCPASATASAGVRWSPDYVCTAPGGVHVEDKGTHCECQDGYIPFRVEHKWTPTGRVRNNGPDKPVTKYYEVYVRCDKSAHDVEVALNRRVSQVDEDYKAAIAQFRQDIGFQREQDLKAIYAEIAYGDDAVMTWVTKNFVTWEQLPGVVRPIAREEAKKEIAAANLWTNRMSFGVDMGFGAYKLPNSTLYTPCLGVTFATPFGAGNDWGMNAQGQLCEGQATNFNANGTARWVGSAGANLHLTYALNKERNTQLWVGGTVRQIWRESGIRDAGYLVGPQIGVRIGVPGTNVGIVPIVGIGATKDTAREYRPGNGPDLGGWGSLNVQFNF